MGGKVQTPNFRLYLYNRGELSEKKKQFKMVDRMIIFLSIRRKSPILYESIEPMNILQ